MATLTIKTGSRIIRVCYIYNPSPVFVIGDNPLCLPDIAELDREGELILAGDFNLYYPR